MRLARALRVVVRSHQCRSSTYGATWVAGGAVAASRLANFRWDTWTVGAAAERRGREENDVFTVGARVATGS